MFVPFSGRITCTADVYYIFYERFYILQLLSLFKALLLKKESCTIGDIRLRVLTSTYHKCHTDQSTYPT